jgi:hypothetical protein
MSSKCMQESSQMLISSSLVSCWRRRVNLPLYALIAFIFGWALGSGCPLNGHMSKQWYLCPASWSGKRSVIRVGCCLSSPCFHFRRPIVYRCICVSGPDRFDDAPISRDALDSTQYWSKLYVQGWTLASSLPS